MTQVGVGGVAQQSDIPFIDLDDIDSTNTEAMRRIAAGERGPLWITAKVQTAGKGRSGRAWVSDTGNLYASLIVSLDCEAAVAHQLSFVAGIAVADAVRAVASPDPLPGLRLKWPNDVLLDGGKLSGMLLESTTDLQRGKLVAVIGIGINIAAPPADLGRAVASLVGSGITADRMKLIHALSGAIGHWLTVWNSGSGFEGVRSAWLERAGPIGETMSINADRGAVSGRFAGIDRDGALLLTLDHGETRRFTHGDVTLDRSARENGQT